MIKKKEKDLAHQETINFSPCKTKYLLLGQNQVRLQSLTQNHMDALDQKKQLQAQPSETQKCEYFCCTTKRCEMFKCLKTNKKMICKKNWLREVKPNFETYVEKRETEAL